MTYHEYTPQPALRDLVRCFWSIEEDHRTRPGHERITPDSAIELVFNLGDPCLNGHYADPLSADQILPMLPPVFVIGVQTRSYYFQTVGLTRVIGVRGYAWSAPLFTPLHTLPIDTDLIALGGDWLSVADSLRHLVNREGDHQAIAALQDYLGVRLVCADRLIDPEQRRLQTLIGTLYRSSGSLPITTLAETSGYSVRQLEREFAALIGIPPKTLTRLIRFESAARRLVDVPNSRLADLACEFGYADQAHFIHDFQKFAGRTPGALLHEILNEHSA